MKTTKWILTILAIFIVSIGIATEKPTMNIVPLPEKKAIIAALNANSAFFELTVENYRGEIMYYKRSEKPLTNYRKTFDFSNLENGKYVMKLKVNDTLLAQNFRITTKGIVPEESHLYFDPYISFEDNRLKLTYLNFDKEEVRMQIFSDKRVIFEKKLGRDFRILDGFDLSKLEKGAYEVVLYSLNHEFSYKLKK